MTLAEVFKNMVGPDAPVEFRAYDGSTSGTAGAPVRITVRSPVAVSYLAQAPGSLGLARAYVSGHLDVDGDMYTALSAGMTGARQVHLGVSERLRLLNELGGPKLLFPRVPPPPQEVRNPFPEFEDLLGSRVEAVAGRIESSGRQASDGLMARAEDCRGDPVPRRGRGTLADQSCGQYQRNHPDRRARRAAVDAVGFLRRRRAVAG